MFKDTYTMSKKIRCVFMLAIISISTSFAIAENKTTIFECKGIATFEFYRQTGWKQKNQCWEQNMQNGLWVFA